MKFKRIAALLLLLAGAIPLRAIGHELNFVVTAAFVSEKGMPVYQEIASYLGKKLKLDARVISGLSYSESDMLLKQGIIQAGFVCGLPYTHAMKEGTYTLAAIPVMAMKKGVYPDVPGYENVPGKYFSYTIVRKDSPLKSWQELRGRSYAYNATPATTCPVTNWCSWGLKAGRGGSQKSRSPAPTRSRSGSSRAVLSTPAPSTRWCSTTTAASKTPMPSMSR